MIKRRLTQKKIAQLLELKEQKVSYWANHEIKTIQRRRKKLSWAYIKKICKLAKDKTASDMGSKKIENIINEILKSIKIFDSNGKILSINFKTVWIY